MADDNEAQRHSDWARRYPPLLTMGIAMLLAVVVLPSSLNVPQTNPTQTLEFAPVPPDDESDEDPPEGNTAALGLGESSSIEGEALGGDGDGPPPPPPDDDGGGRVDPGTACVGEPPRQTFDPLAPPCVPFWDQASDNGGATYAGVTSEEIRLLVAFDGGINYTSGSDASNRGAPRNKIYDLHQSAEECREQNSGDGGCTHLVTRGLRVWQDYFNQRFQTYGRQVHFYVSFSEGVGATPERRRAEAALHLDEIDPFAVVSFLSEGAEDDYLFAMARGGVLNFGSFGLRDSEFYNTFPGMIWSYLPSIEQQSQSYVNYVCRQVVGPDPDNPHVANLAGGELRNEARKLGMISTNNRFQPGLKKLAQIVKTEVESCGGEIVDHIEFENCCLARDNGDPPDDEQQEMARFQSQGITTILWPGGGNGNYAQSAQAINYQPEWIVAGGDSFQDNATYHFYAQSGGAYDGRGIAISPRTLEPPLGQQLCFQAFREFSATFDRRDLDYVCEYYTNLFQFFVGVQVAGPFVGPTQIDKGFHAIPQKTSSADPRIPACFYLPGDYTCVKDAVAMMWDQEGQVTGTSTPGCFRLIDNGKRYLPGEWPVQQVAADHQPNDPCTGYSESVRVTLA
ncbi:MAG TPA: hypothetical protein VGA13_03850 [Acidimicrobiales bacterium]